MKVQIELFGASRDFSNKNSLHFDLDQNSTIKDVRKKLIDYLDNNFNGNDNYKKFHVFIHFFHNHTSIFPNHQVFL